MKGLVKNKIDYLYEFHLGKTFLLESKVQMKKLYGKISERYF
jgi:hypothetical protein